MKNNRNRHVLDARAGDELSLLVSLVRNEQIGAKMLLQNVLEILEDDESLLVDVVLLITDAQRIHDSDANEEDFANALVAVKRSNALTVKPVLVSALEHAAQKAKSGTLALPS